MMGEHQPKCQNLTTKTFSVFVWGCSQDLLAHVLPPLAVQIQAGAHYHQFIVWTEQKNIIIRPAEIWRTTVVREGEL